MKKTPEVNTTKTDSAIALNAANETVAAEAEVEEELLKKNPLTKC
jgi:hypothetical protein